MILDKQNLFDEAAAITVTRNSTNVIDLTKTGQDIGVGERLFIVVAVTEAFTTGDAAVLAIAVVTDDNTALSSATTLQSKGTYAASVLTLGREPIIFVIEPTNLQTTMERYLGLIYTVTVGSFTAGKVTAGVTHDIARSKAYPKNYATA